MQIIGSSFATFLESQLHQQRLLRLLHLYMRLMDAMLTGGAGRGPWLWTACTLLSMALMSHAVFELY
jgi:hypothetical protein